jgi:hypothetical protein
MEDSESSRDSSDSESVVSPKAMVGQMFHRFRCIRILGQGAMATVLLGEDIALKRISPGVRAALITARHRGREMPCELWP